MISFDVPGDPVPKGRPRHTKGGHTYTPRRTTDYEAEIGGWWLRSRGIWLRPYSDPVALTVEVHERIHASDLDNYVKVAMDALNGLAWDDDRQVERITATITRKSSTPMLRITVTPLDAL